MKNRIFILFAAIVGLNTADAQISIHPQIGGSLNKIQVFEKNEIGSIWGFQGGVGLDFKLGDVFSLEPILRYNQKGYGFENSFDWAPGVTFTEKYSLRLHYLELPVMANFNTEVGDINLVYSVGPYFGYCMAAREIIEITDGTDTEISDSKNNENFNDINAEIGLL